MIRGVYEAVLYADDLVRASAFYREILGLRTVNAKSDLLIAFRLPDGGILLVFDPLEASKPGREVPSHGTVGAGAGEKAAGGNGHVAFRIDPGEYDRWILRFRSHNIVIEQEIRWEGGARSIYIRDPAGNSVELVEGEIWAE